MRKKIIELLKSVGILKRPLKRLQRIYIFFGRFLKRKPRHIFHSSNISFSRARQPFMPADRIRQKLEAIENKRVEGISLYKDVLAYPIKLGKGKDYSGGLVDSKTNMLIEEGIHRREAGQFSQEYPQMTAGGIADADLPEIPQVVLFGGILYNHFGHFLLESLGRLWAYDSVRDLNPYILFFNDMGYPGYLEKRNFIYQVFSGFNIPHKKVIFVNSSVRLKQVIIPTQKYGYELCKTPDHLFLKFINSFRFPTVIPTKFKNSNKVYVSRSKVPMGRLIGEIIFEEYMSSEGYTIFHPELYSIYQQLSVYNNARKIIFCDGAALHACILLPSLKADIAVIARRRDRVWVCKDIIDQFQGYKKNVLWIDSVKDQYQFGLQSWHALSIVDWYEISKTLQKAQFVKSLCKVFHDMDFAAVLRSEVRNHLATITNLPEYTDFMIRLKEPSWLNEDMA